ncbi:hypothetical protein Sjap_023714 [Stephania japonica]|uniref:Pre-rRNA-processing protein Ipi1 N-terminal domain-containing protein n=1 Tax=Stephania japonica TaxID=461633 RepID=A0AAP0HMZ7_9MAGN
MAKSKTQTKKKPQKQRGVDFKKIKRKIGRKLPPPKNATNTEIKSKAIVLPEQSVASDRAGLAVSKKGLTLKELLQQTSHYNAKVRKDALIGIREVFLKYPGELRLHRLALIEKLRERITDEDRVVRDTLYQLLKSVIFPQSKEEISGPFTSLMMAYIFNAMTHLAIDIRLMAFKFFDLLVEHFPSSFLSYAEKVLQNYEDILQKYHIYLQDRSKLKNTLVGLVHCLSLLPSAKGELEKTLDDKRLLHAFEDEVPRETSGVSSIVKKVEDLVPVLIRCFQELTSSVRVMPLVNAQSYECMLCVLQSIDLAVNFFVHVTSKCEKGFEGSVPCIYKESNVKAGRQSAMPMLLKKLLDVFPLTPCNGSSGKDGDRYYVLNVGLVEVFLHYGELLVAPDLLERILEFLESSLSGQMDSNTRSTKALAEKHLVQLLPFIPKIISKAESNWKYRLLQAFTKAFKGCKPESSLSLGCLCAIEDMLIPLNGEDMLLDPSDVVVVGNQITWIRELPVLLVQLGDKHPSFSKVVLHLMLHLGQRAPLCNFIAWEYDSMQHSFRDFFCRFLNKSEGEGHVEYGPFVVLPIECQELAICSLYYFSKLDSLLLSSLAYCCFGDHLDPFVLLRVIEILQSSYKAGHTQISDLISFFVTLLARFRVYPERRDYVFRTKGDNSNFKTYKAITSSVCSCLSQIGDDTLVLQMLQNVILHEMSQKPPLDNSCAMFRVLALLDSRPTSLSENNIINLANLMVNYLIGFAYNIPEKKDVCIDSDLISTTKYYLIPCFVLFAKSNKLLKCILNLMGASVAEYRAGLPSFDGVIPAFDHSGHARAISFVLVRMHEDVKLHKSLSACKVEIMHILHCFRHLQSNKVGLSLGERQKVQLAFDQVKSIIGRVHGWNDDIAIGISGAV